MSYLISGVEQGEATFRVAEFESAVRERWSDAVESVGRAGDGMLVADIRPRDEPGYSIRVALDGEVISTDGTREQVADVAVWALSLLPPAEVSKVVLYDAEGLRPLRSGMSTAEVWSGWHAF